MWQHFPYRLFQSLLSFDSGICHPPPQQQHTSTGKGTKLEANTEDPAPTAPALLQNAARRKETAAPVLPPLSPVCSHLCLLSSSSSLLLPRSSCSSQGAV